jgi:hypothetical protein
MGFSTSLPDAGGTLAVPDLVEEKVLWATLPSRRRPPARAPSSPATNWMRPGDVASGTEF